MAAQMTDWAPGLDAVDILIPGTSSHTGSLGSTGNRQGSKVPVTGGLL